MAFCHTLFRSLLLLNTALDFVFLVHAKESAWNGHTTPGSQTPSVFSPYYVPPGAKSFDSASPLVTYIGEWREIFSAGYVHGSSRSTSRRNAAVKLTFTGTGIEWFGSKNRNHGEATVFIDGKPLAIVNTYIAQAIPLKQQRLYWNYQLPYGKHTIKIVNRPSQGSLIDVDAFVVTRGNPPTKRRHSIKDLTLSRDKISPQWNLIQRGTTGVNAMQLTIISSTHALIVDKVEHNPLTVSDHPAWGALYNLKTHSVKPLNLQSNSFCAGGSFLGNGTLVNVGGNPVIQDHTASADFGDMDGMQAIRLFHPCLSSDVENCDMYENHSRIRMASPRWYNTVTRLLDGSVIIIGGSKKGGWINNATVNNPTIEYYPPKSIHGSNGMPIHLPFLDLTLGSNLFPIVFSLPSGSLFVAANQDAMIYDWVTNTERRLPRIPNGVRMTYPMTGSGVLLPLTYENDFAPEVLLCGGSDIDDQKPSYKISSQDVASTQCSRMLLTEEGIAAGWQVDHMPEARTMADAVLLPTGQVVIVNGAGSGISGYGNVLNQVGASNADHPVYRPVLYSPNAAVGQRFSSQGIPKSNIPRLYHSVATLTPSGTVMIAGSNPNLDRSEIEYGTEYRVEWLAPPYMSMDRPQVIASPPNLEYGKTYQIKLKAPTKEGARVQVAIMDLGYVTHAVHANMRMVYLEHSVTNQDVLSVTGPPNGGVYSPGPGWLFVIVDDVPSEGVRIMVGDGEGPAVEQAVIENVLKQTAVDQ